MARPHTCSNWRPGPYTIDQCHLCWAYETDPKIRAYFDAAPVLYIGLAVDTLAQLAVYQERRKAQMAGCANRGAKEPDTIPCSTCAGNVQIKVYACAAHGRCTLGQRLPGIAGACDGACPEWAAP
jgi:hypothetical protein